MSLKGRLPQYPGDMARFVVDTPRGMGPGCRIPWRIPGTLAGLWSACATLSAQPTCAITVGPDTTICQGQTVQLSATPGFANYLWSTGGTGPGITVGAADTYWCQATQPTGNLTVNGNFSAGNTGFTTDFTYNTNLNLGDGHYWIGTNAASHHPQFSGTGSGSFMIVNAGWAAAHFMVWCQDVSVCPEQTYTLSYRARTVSNATPARLQWWIDGTASGPEVNLPDYNTGWQTITHSWTSPSAAGPTASFCLRAMSGEGVGNDFGLDDISIGSTLVVVAEAIVQVKPVPEVDLGPDTVLCEGATLALDATIPGGSYLWQDGDTGPSRTVSGPGTHSVTVTVDGCPNSDAITVLYNPPPSVDLGPGHTLCPGAQTTLDATIPGGTYLWSTGATTPTITVSQGGDYSVTVTDPAGCEATGQITIGEADAPPVEPICANAVMVNLANPTPGDPADTNWGCLGGAPLWGSWYMFTVVAGGDIGFTLQPEGPSNEYDWAVWGPFPSGTVIGSLCLPPGTPTRCESSSTSAVLAATGGYGTGMGQYATPLFDSPGTAYSQSGNGCGGQCGWTPGLTAQPGEVYLLYVDNRAQDGNTFDLVWASGNGGSIACGILPVELVGPVAEAGRDQVALGWTTLSERGSGRFLVERAGGDMRFTAIGEVRAAGWSHTPIDYRFTDPDPMPGINYYRLRQEDLGGGHANSNTVGVRFQRGNGDIRVRPNPANERVALELPAAREGPYTVELYDASGRSLRWPRPVASPAPMVLDASLHGLEPGAYLVRVLDQDGVAIGVARFVKE